MILRLFILILLSITLQACKENTIQNSEFDKKYKVNECIARVNINRNNLSNNASEELQEFITPKGILNSYKDKHFPHFIVVTSKNRLEYYFFFSYQCSKKISLVKKIVSKYFLNSNKKYEFKAESVTLDSVPQYLGIPIGRWLDR